MVSRTGLMAGILLALGAVPVSASAENYTGPGFSGDAFVSNAGQPLQQVGSVNVGAEGFRMNMVDQGRRIASLVRWSDHMVYSLFLDEKAYLQMPAEQVGMEEYEDRPCVGFRDGEKLGPDTVDGRPVEKWRCTGELNPAQGRAPADATTWYDRELEFEIRIQRDGGETFEVRNVTVGEQDSALFEVPGDFQKVDMEALRRQMQQQQQQQQQRQQQ